MVLSEAFKLHDRSRGGGSSVPALSSSSRPREQLGTWAAWSPLGSWYCAEMVLPARKEWRLKEEKYIF